MVIVFIIVTGIIIFLNIEWEVNIRGYLDNGGVLFLVVEEKWLVKEIGLWIGII